MPFLVIFKPHGELHLNTQYIGPFDTHDEAHDALAQMPALGSCPSEHALQAGVKWIAELHTALDQPRMAARNGWGVLAYWDTTLDCDRIRYRIVKPGAACAHGAAFNTEAQAWEAAAYHYMKSTQVDASASET